ncbi:MAG TPA: succinylglutamate desuccinylase/aspartoacylase family protein [Thermoanaerobaculia bacterium]
MRNIVLLCFALSTSLLAQEFSVGTAVAGRGEVAYGALEVPAGSDAATTIPVAVINGARNGRVFAFIAGSHGTEYASSIALTRLIPRIDPKTLSGVVIIAPLLNVASFEQMTVHLNPIDKKGMNAQYPGDASGTQTQRALALVTQQIVKRADVIVDLHGGDLDEDLVPYSYWMRTGNATLDAASKALALAFGLDRIIVNDVDLKNPASTRSLSGYSLSIGKTVLVAEAGYSGRVEADDVHRLVEGCLNVLQGREAGITPMWLGSGTRLRADAPGMWTPAVRGGAYVTQGMRLGTMTDYLGRNAKDLRSPAAGIVTFIRGVPSVWKDATLANVSPVLAEP